MTKRWVLNFLFMALGAFVLLLAFNLAGYGPAIVKHESVRVVLPPRPPVAVHYRHTRHKPQPALAVISPVVVPPVVVQPVVVPPVVVQPTPAPVPPPAPLCPRVGYYRLSHEPTTDWRQFNDYGNWIPGHMELVKECRNGALNEFSIWVGHRLPGE